ncbi:DUF2971 domain-containing protein, partial [Methanosarcina mazei]
MKKLKLIKFRSLAGDDELERIIKDIIKENSFWCSKLWKLNDPMEGVFSTYNSDSIQKIFFGKNNIVICSFSGEKALKNPLMWGYYANGFKGIAIETEVEINNHDEVINSEGVINGKIVKVVYDNKSFSSANKLTIEQIMTRKLEDWTHEEEYRFLKEGNEGLYEIGEINKIYFGSPYYNVNNRKEIIDNSVPLQEYEKLKNKLKDFCETLNKKIYLEDYIM